jgi:hypothetical protein
MRTMDTSSIILYGSVSGLLLIISCALVHPGSFKPVVIRNGTDIAVRVDPDAQAGSIPHIVLQPGKQVDGSWQLMGHPGMRLERTVKAYDQNDQLVFCRHYTASSRDPSILTITISHGHIQC